MQIVLIVLFAALLSPGLIQERALYAPLTTRSATLMAVAVVSLAIPLIIGIASWICLRKLRRPGGFTRAAALFGHVHTAMRMAILAGFGALVTQTGWLNVVRHGWQPFGVQIDRIPLAVDLVLLAPILVAIILCYLVMYPTDRALRQAATAGLSEELTGQPIWNLSQYMDFQIRNQLLTVLVPMGLFIMAADLAGMYRVDLVRLTGQVWAPEASLALTAIVIFIFSPVILRFVWRTQRLPMSPLRTELEKTCRRMGLRYRDILIWQSHGAMVNAAVMGLMPHIRYILLSDGLLEHLTQDQVEAVFGHEAGHVREHHIAYYMMFAVASMIAVSLTGDYLVRQVAMAPETVEMVVVGIVVFIWFVLFGWISRRFERQADLHGVRCLNEKTFGCSLPCWQHTITPEQPIGERLCTTGAQIFASALEAVAVLNGISKYARSWRHSSIASRQEFVRQAAYYPETLRRFERTVSRIKATLVGATFMLGLVALWFYWPILFPPPAPRFEPRKEPAMWVKANPDRSYHSRQSGM